VRGIASGGFWCRLHLPISSADGGCVFLKREGLRDGIFTESLSILIARQCVYYNQSDLLLYQSRFVKVQETFLPISTQPKALLSKQVRSNIIKMAPASIELTAPNGVKWSQPTGLFINNEFVASSSGQTLTSIDPA
jgi:hypothetical protein